MSEMTYQESMELRFDMCLKRLVKLRSFKAPSPIIINEMAMLIDRCALLYGGAELWAQIGKRSTERARLAAGFCPYDDAEEGVRPLAPGESMCAKCAAESAAIDETTAVDESEAEPAERFRCRRCEEFLTRKDVIDSPSNCSTGLTHNREDCYGVVNRLGRLGEVLHD